MLAKLESQTKKFRKGQNSQTELQKQTQAILKLLHEFIGKALKSKSKSNVDVNTSEGKAGAGLIGVLVIGNNNKEILSQCESGQDDSMLSQSTASSSHSSQGRRSSIDMGNFNASRGRRSSIDMGNFSQHNDETHGVSGGQEVHETSKQSVAEVYVRRQVAESGVPVNPEDIKNMAHRRRHEIWQVPMPSIMIDEEDDDNVAKNRRASIKGPPIIPWTRDEEELQRTKDAMEVAAGFQVHNISTMKEEEQKQELRRIQKELFGEFQLSVVGAADECSDLDKIVQYKAIRTWLPQLMLWLSEMEKYSYNCQRGNVDTQHANKVHMDGARYILQLVERILFSITEFIEFQGAGLEACCALEECHIALPKSTPFLPYRTGEMDSDKVRTPKDEEDAQTIVGVKEAEEEAEDTHRMNGSVTFMTESNMESRVGMEKGKSGTKERVGVSRASIRRSSTRRTSALPGGAAALNSMTSSAFFAASSQSRSQSMIF